MNLNFEMNYLFWTTIIQKWICKLKSIPLRFATKYAVSEFPEQFMILLLILQFHHYHNHILVQQDQGNILHKLMSKHGLWSNLFPKSDKFIETLVFDLLQSQ